MIKIVTNGSEEINAPSLSLRFAISETNTMINNWAKNYEDLTNNNETRLLEQHIVPGTVIVMCSCIKKQRGDSLEAFEQNLKMVINVCKNLFSDNLLRFVYVSSAEVYGEDLNDLFITEDTPIAPTSYYGMAKHISELIIKKSLVNYPSTSYVILRPPLVFGPGEEDSFYGPSGFIKAAIKNE